MRHRNNLHELELGLKIARLYHYNGSSGKCSYANPCLPRKATFSGLPKNLRLQGWPRQQLWPAELLSSLLRGSGLGRLYGARTIKWSIDLANVSQHTYSRRPRTSICWADDAEATDSESAWRCKPGESQFVCLCFPNPAN